ncbi:hypothetical protein [Paenibacillus sp. UMB4589-SE434]|nr:hypothetical protein [Paenibacillus sp. UMB4589-SE434]MDK8183740.1 hypothetical protein [Paenibacillus sp. UMB4589-SE434]
MYSIFINDLNKKTGYVVKQSGSSVNLTVSGLYNIGTRLRI